MSASCSTLLDELGIADETIVHYSTDNGPHYNTWPDAADAVPGEKNSNWEGGWRVPCAVRWPGVIKPGRLQRDHAPHGLAADLSRRRGRPDIKDELLEGGVEALGREYKVHLDGYDITRPTSAADRRRAPRKEVFYFSDDGRPDRAALSGLEADLPGAEATRTLRVWADPWTPLRVPDDPQPAPRPLRARPVTSNTYYDWMIDRVFLLVPAQAYVGNFLKTFKEYPPRMKAASFSIDQVMQKMKDAGER
jgi:arylsulfatase A-like enzyme